MYSLLVKSFTTSWTNELPKSWDNINAGTPLINELWILDWWLLKTFYKNNINFELQNNISQNHHSLLFFVWTTGKEDPNKVLYNPNVIVFQMGRMTISYFAAIPTLSSVIAFKPPK